MSASEPSTVRAGAKDTWSVVVVYEDTGTRERAMAVCDHLIKEFWANIEFEFHWWRTDFLQDPELAGDATRTAAAAQFVIFCPSGKAEWSPAVSEWAERWARQRGEQPGALVDLSERAAVPSTIAFHKATFLSKIAQQAGMDYLSEDPWTTANALKDSLETLDQRATSITSVLDEILHFQPPPHIRVDE
jgi:hypothetical protein